MRLIQKRSGAVLGLVFAVACGSADTGDSPEVVDIASPSSPLPTSNEGETAPGAEAASNAAAAGNGPEGVELARIDFQDGTRVRFERLGEGLLVSEVTSQGTAPHLLPKPGWSALDAFRALAPEREVPRALLQAHPALFPVGSAATLGRVDAVADPGEPAAEDFTLDADLEHNGQFQQSDGSFPFATFTAQMCVFSESELAYKHGNVTFTHSHETANINTAFYAVGGDIGTVTSRPCSNGECSTFVNIFAGQGSSAFFDAGIKCTGGGGIGCQIFGCPDICAPRQVKFNIETRSVSSAIRFHHCSKFTR